MHKIQIRFNFHQICIESKFFNYTVDSKKYSYLYSSIITELVPFLEKLNNINIDNIVFP